MTPRILVVTPLLRSYGRAIVAAHRLVRRAPCPVEWLVLPEQPYAGYDYRNILNANNRARDVALRGAYSHLLMLEDDIIAPPDTIAHLLECDADVAYGLYCWRRGGMHLWNCYRKGKSLAVTAPGEAVAAFSASDVLSVDGVGFGCTLISREALRRTPFRLSDDFDRGGASTDWMFAADCVSAGLTQVCHTAVVCGHIAMEPSPRVIWPALEGGKPLHRFELFEAS